MTKPAPSAARALAHPRLALSAIALLALAGCGAKTPRGVFAHGNGPNEFVVGRSQPLVVPPDFALVPPRPGAPRPQEADSSTQALNTLFGGRARASAGEEALLQQAGPPPETGIRSTANGGDTTIVNKGSQTRDIVAAPATTDAKANATTNTPAADTPATTPATPSAK